MITLQIEEAFEQETEMLKPDERDRLMLAIVYYQMGAELPALTGNELFLWPVYRTRIDQNRAVSESRAAAGRRSGESRRNKAEQTGTNLNKTEQTGTNLNKIEQTGTALQAVQPEKESTPEPLKEKESERRDTKPPQAPRNGQAEKLFARFWAAYPRKENKKNAFRAFVRMQPDEALLGEMLRAIERQRGSPQWQEDGGKYIPQPSTWLNGERWEDIPSMHGNRKSVTAQNYQQRDYTEEELLAVSDDIIAQIIAERENDKEEPDAVNS